jgi:hypothetical protein
VAAARKGGGGRRRWEAAAMTARSRSLQRMVRRCGCWEKAHGVALMPLIISVSGADKP